MCDAHCTVVKMAGVQEPSPEPSVSLLKAPVQVVLSGRVASSSGGQQAGSVCAGALEQASWPVDVEAAASPPSPSTALSAPPRRRPRRRGARQTTYDDLVGDDDDSNKQQLLSRCRSSLRERECVLCVCECFAVLLFCVVFVFVVCVVCV